MRLPRPAKPPAVEVVGCARRESKGVRAGKHRARQEGLRAFSAGDIEKVMNTSDDDVGWVQPGRKRGQRHLSRQRRIRPVPRSVRREVADGAAQPSHRRWSTRSSPSPTSLLARKKVRRRRVHHPRRQDGTGTDAWRHSVDGARVRQEAGHHTVERLPGLACPTRRGPSQKKSARHPAWVAGRLLRGRN